MTARPAPGRQEAGAPPPNQAPPAGWSEDRLLDGRVVLRQPVAGYRSAIDPVFLAAAVPAQRGERVLDLGCGVGAAALCLLARVPDLQAVGLELQPELARAAGDNARRNGHGGRFLAIAGDVRRPPPRLAPGSFDHVLCNPPHHAAARTRPAADAGRARANREGDAGLADWVAAAAAMLRPKGSVSLVHRADRLDELLAALHGRLGEIVVFPLWPGGDKPAKRVILRARKGVATPLALRPGLVLHAADGAFTPAAQAVLRGGQALPL